MAALLFIFGNWNIDFDLSDFIPQRDRRSSDSGITVITARSLPRALIPTWPIDAVRRNTRCPQMIKHRGIAILELSVIRMFEDDSLAIFLRVAGRSLADYSFEDNIFLSVILWVFGFFHVLEALLKKRVFSILKAIRGILFGLLNTFFDLIAA